MEGAREGAGPDADIFIECSEFLSPRTAVMLDEALHPYRPGWFEEPIPFENAKAMAALQRDLRTPIATGERLLSRYEYREFLENGGCRIIQPDLMHAGGFTEIRKIAALADMYSVPVAPHNPGGPICTAAAMHLAAAIPNFYILEQMEPQRALRDRASTVPIRFENGCFLLPEGPGLGVEPNLDALARTRVPAAADDRTHRHAVPMTRRAVPGRPPPAGESRSDCGILSTRRRNVMHQRLLKSSLAIAVAALAWTHAAAQQPIVLQWQTANLTESAVRARMEGRRSPSSRRRIPASRSSRCWSRARTTGRSSSPRRRRKRRRASSPSTSRPRPTTAT